MSEKYSEQQKTALESLETAFKELDAFVNTTTCEWCAEKGKALSEAMKKLMATQKSIYSMSIMVKDIDKGDENNGKNNPGSSLGTLGDYSVLTPKKKSELVKIIQECEVDNRDKPFPANLVAIGKCLIDKSTL